MKRTLYTGLLIAATMLIASCSTDSSAVKRDGENETYDKQTHDGITFHFRYLDAQDLFALYSQRNNPFVHYKSGRLLVIDTTIETDIPLTLNLEYAQLSTPGGDRGPTANQEVYEYWFSRLKHNYGTKSRFYTPHKSETLDPHGSGGSASSTGVSYGGVNKNQYHNWSLKVVTQIIDETILPPVFEVQPGTARVGYMLFDQVRGEKKVDATLTLPAYTDEGALIHEFRFTFPI
jgi:hypothetical protein